MLAIDLRGRAPYLSSRRITVGHAMKTAAKIVSKEGILAGIPVVSGTRVPAENVLVEVRAGTSRFEIFRHYPSLPPDAIEACVAWEKAGRPV
jgi:uncharacterized protein (DUF433 family)